MSRVHLTFVHKSKNQMKDAFEVISPDFSERGTEREVIGELVVDLEQKNFIYKPIDKLKPYFCPPEYFEKYTGDIEKVDKVCDQEKLMCTIWSYRIYQKAKQVLEENLAGTGTA